LLILFVLGSPLICSDVSFYCAVQVQDYMKCKIAIHICICEYLSIFVAFMHNNMSE